MPPVRNRANQLTSDRAGVGASAQSTAHSGTARGIVCHSAAEHGRPFGGIVKLSHLQALKAEGGYVYRGCMDAYLEYARIGIPILHFLPISIPRSFLDSWLRFEPGFDLQDLHDHATYDLTEGMINRYHTLLIYSYQNKSFLRGRHDDTYCVGIVIHDFRAYAHDQRACVISLLDPFPEVFDAQGFSTTALKQYTTSLVTALARRVAGRHLSTVPQWQEILVESPAHPSDTFFSIVGAADWFCKKEEPIKRAFIGDIYVKYVTKMRGVLHGKLLKEHGRRVAMTLRTEALQRVVEIEEVELARLKKEQDKKRPHRLRQELREPQRKCVVCCGEYGVPEGGATQCSRCYSNWVLSGGQDNKPPKQRLAQGIDTVKMVKLTY